MAWPKLKQDLENSWYRWASQDRQTWYAAQFQYGENVNIRDMKNGVCLSWGSTDVWSALSYEFSYFTYDWALYTVDKKWVIRDDTWATVYNLNINSVQVPQGIQFWDDMYVVSAAWVHKITQWWTIWRLWIYHTKIRWLNSWRKALYSQWLAKT